MCALFLIIALVACNSGTPTPAGSPDAPAEGAKAKGAFIGQSLANESNAYMWKCFQQYQDEYGFEMSVFEGGNDVQNEAKAVSTCIAQGFKAIFIDPSDINAIVPALTEAKEAGLVVGLISSDVDPSVADTARTIFCGVDDVMAGVLAGDEFVKNFPNGAKVVEVGGQAGHDGQIKRRDGFRQAIEGTNIEILDSQNCSGWITAEAMAIMEDFIVKYGDQIDGVFCHWDNGATGVIQALKAAGIEGVFVAGVDGCAAGFDQVLAGTQQVCISQSFEKMVIASLANARLILDGKPYTVDNFVDLDVVTPETIKNFPYPEW